MVQRRRVHTNSMGEIVQIYRDRKKQEGIPMKLGFVTAILDSWNYEEMMDFASE